MTRFNEVAEFNESFGNAQGNPEQLDWVAIEAQYKMIASELEEILEGIEKRNLKLVRDGAGDVLVTAYGMFHRVGHDADEDLIEINRSNNTKLCRNTDVAIRTARKYEKGGVEVKFYYPGDGRIAVLSAKDQNDLQGRFIPAGKLLKSVEFEEPILE
jgi:NTP pyrophosphatase (non-canonical NTP hydrolase)